MVHNIEFATKDEFLDAAELLVKRCGRFNMLPGHVLSVSEDQLTALVEAGLVSPNGDAGRNRGKENTQRKKPGSPPW